jgi:hypothetical protein
MELGDVMRARVLQKSEFFSQCEDANIPKAMVPWHKPCDVNGNAKCEVGSECKDSGLGSFCKPLPEMLLIKPSEGGSRSKGAMAGAIIGIVALIAVAVCSGFGANPFITS